jgi:hypothetical protein
MTPLQIACRHQNPDYTNCGAEAGKPCVWSRGTFGPYTNVQDGDCFLSHSERILDAAAMSGAEPVPASEIDKVVEEMGIA